MRLIKFILPIIIVLSFSACDFAQNYTKIDRESDMEFQDYRDFMAPREVQPEQVKGNHGNVPELMPYIASDSQSIKPTPLVSIQVNQTVPIRDILFELANQAGYDIELDPRITGSIIFTARNKPFDMVVRRIADMAGLRYRFSDDDVLRVELDTPYLKTYKVDFMNISRESTGNIGNATSISVGESGSTGSGFDVESKTELDLWKDVESNLEQIIGSDTTLRALRTDNDPKISAVASPRGAQDSIQGNREAVLKVESLPVDSNSSGNSRFSRSSGGSDRSDDGLSTFSMNRQAGTITVFATEFQHKQVSEYLDIVKKQVTTQVLIEAKVLEVSLTDEFSSGINWEALKLAEGRVDFGFTTGDSVRASFVPPSDPLTNFVLGYTGGDISTVIEAIARFGTVRALASPRITVMNNNPAVLNVADNRVYFKVDIDVDRDDFGVTRTIESEAQSVPEGVMISVIPSIDADKQTVTLSVRPSITRIVDYINDPAVSYLLATEDLDFDIGSAVPVLNQQEMESVINMRSGQAVIMGGLMQDRHISEQNAVPVLGEIPVLGGMFRNQNDYIGKSELVVLLRATIINNDNIHPTDKDIYRKFSRDRRPFSL